MFSETLHTMMSLRSIAGETGLYLFMKMYLAVSKWSHGADVWGACNVRTPQTGCPLSTSISISGENHAPRCLVFYQAGINSLNIMWCYKVLYFSFCFFFLFFLCFFLSLFSLFCFALFSAFCSFPFLCLILLICIYIFRSPLMFPIIYLNNFSLFCSYFSLSIIMFCLQFL